MTFDRKNYISKSKRIVIKIGSSLLTDSKKRGIRTRFLNQMAAQVKKLSDSRLQCVIVTSGAIAAGMFELGLGKRPKEMAKLQALAAVGQSSLMHRYEVAFKRRGLKVAQILLTREDLSNRSRYSNAQNTFMELFNHGIIPIVNENDSVAVEEIKFGDNDTLGVLVAHLCESDLLVLLTDTDGFFSEDPRLNPRAELISEVVKLDPQMEKSASLSMSVVGTGGMQTKIQAAKNMMQSGVPMVIANGNTPSILNRILNSEKIGTFFQPSVKKMPSRKRWLAWSVKPKGSIIVDEGAKAALVLKDKSLLPTGIKMVSGIWEKGEVVKIIGLDGGEIARGISNYSSRELELIKGMKTSEVSKKLGPVAADEVVHRDNLVKV
jgi:glutamate 5-kinase